MHGSGCFREVEVADKMPAQTFSHQFKDADGTLVLSVDVSAPEGALPAGSTMKVEWVDEAKVDRNLVQAALDAEAAKEKESAGKLLDLQAFTITFEDTTGVEVKPASEVTITLTSALVNSGEVPAVVGVETDAEAKAKAALEGKEEYEISAGAMEALNEKALQKRKLTLADDQLAFDATDFTQYVLATTSREMKMVSEGETVRVTVDAPAEAGIPQDSTIRVVEIAAGTQEYEAYEADALNAMDAHAAEFARFFDITILDPQGTEIQPQAPVSVKIKLEDAPLAGEQPSVVHFDESAGEPASEIIPAEANNLTTKFEAESFSVYGVVYTVDFHYAVDGKSYEFTLPGGGFVSLTDLVELLGVASETNAKNAESEDAPIEGAGAVFDTTHDASSDANSTSAENAADPAHTLNDVVVSDTTREFVSNIDHVEFSTPSLLSVSKVEDDTSVGAIKDYLGLTCTYSAELTEDDIARINNTQVKAGDWALISLQPFQSDEYLTVTMVTGEAFAIHVTDALHVKPDELVGKEIIIFDKTDNRALTAHWEQNKYRTQFESVEYGGEGTVTPSNAHWTVEKSGGNYYLKSYDGKYLKFDNTNVSLVGRNEATPLTIQMGDNPDYRIYAENEDRKILTYSENGTNPAFFAAPNGTAGTGTTRTWLGIDYATPTPEPVGDWLLYFDDDFDEITVHVGETITLRPYDKWQWKEGNADVQRAHWNVGGKDDRYWGQIDSGDNNGAHEAVWDSGGDASNTAKFHWTAYVKKDSELETHYWSLQGRATQTGVFYLTNTKNNNKTIKVNVVNGDPVNRPPTIADTVDIKVNLFDYDKNYTLDPTSNNNLANNNNNKNESTNAMGGGNHFYFMSSGAGNNNNERWNNYTKGSANPYIVKAQLDNDGYPVLEGNGKGNQSLKYLFDPSKTSWNGGNNDGMIAYPNVNGMFRKDSDGYYYYNSNTNYFYYDSTTQQSKLYQHTYTQTSGADKGSLVNDKPIGFFPFHDYDATDNLYVNQNHALNHHIGMSMEIPFKMNSTKKDENGNPIKFEFTGDDDLWVFAEWEDAQGNKHSKLLLDRGGIHQPVYGYIDFTHDSSSSSSSLGLQPDVDYKLKVYYLERGGCDSNLAIRFNLPLTNIGDIPFTKKDAETGNPLPGAVFGLYRDQACTEANKVRQATADASGYVLFNDVSIGTYYMKEITPPEGYKPSTAVYTVEVKAKNQAQITLINSEQAPSGYSYTINNTPIQLTVKKVWLQEQGASKPDEVYFKLYKKGNPDAEVTSRPGYVADKGYCLNTANSWKTTFKNLDDGTYYVVEETLQSFTTLYAAKDVATDQDESVKAHPTEALADEDGNLTILNKPAVGALQLTKVVQVNDRAPQTNEEKALTNGTYEFTVAGVANTATAGVSHTVKITFEGGKATKYQIDANAEQTASGTDNTWSVVLSNLPAGDYTVSETAPESPMVLKSVTGGKSVDGTTKIATATVAASDMVPAQSNAKVEFTNNCTDYEVVIVKVDATNDAVKLGGAEFDLYKAASVEERDGKLVVKQGEHPLNADKLVTSSGNGADKGKVSLGTLTAGMYYLFETKAPAGYNAMDVPAIVTVADGSVSINQGLRQEVGTITQDRVELKVLNSAGVELPNAGGPGTFYMTIAGLACIIAGVLSLLRRRSVA